MLIGFALFLIMLSKMFMWLLLALAPLFIILLLFGVTTRFFSGWLSALVQYFLGAGSRLCIPGLLRLADPADDRYAERRRQSRAATWATIGPVVLLAIIGILLLSQINNMAAAIAGGVPIGAPRIGACYATVTGDRAALAANRARLAFRNPFNPASIVAA